MSQNKKDVPPSKTFDLKQPISAFRCPLCGEPIYFQVSLEVESLPDHTTLTARSLSLKHRCRHKPKTKK